MGRDTFLNFETAEAPVLTGLTGKHRPLLLVFGNRYRYIILCSSQGSSISSFSCRIMHNYQPPRLFFFHGENLMRVLESTICLGLDRILLFHTLLSKWQSALG